MKKRTNHINKLYIHKTKNSSKNIFVGTVKGDRQILSIFAQHKSFMALIKKDLSLRVVKIDFRYLGGGTWSNRDIKGIFSEEYISKFFINYLKNEGFNYVRIKDFRSKFSGITKS